MNKFLLSLLLVGVICVQQFECQDVDGPPLIGGMGGPPLLGGVSGIDASEEGFIKAMKELKKHARKTNSITTNFKEIYRQLRQNDKLTKKNKAGRSDITNVQIEQQVVSGMKYVVSFTCKKDLEGICQVDRPNCKFSFVYQSWMTPSIQVTEENDICGA